MELIDIKQCDLIFVWGTSWLSKIIQEYEIIDMNIDYLPPSHVCLYLGYGNMTCISAEYMIKYITLEKYLKKNIRFEAWSYPGITVEQAHIIKESAKSSLGKPYDLPGLLTFLLKYFPEGMLKNQLAKRIKPSDYADWCSENSYRPYWIAGLDFMGSIKPEKIHPGILYAKSKERLMKSYG